MALASSAVVHAPRLPLRETPLKSLHEF